jgi:hypothetical protein
VDDAIAQYKLALEEDPKFAEARSNLGRRTIPKDGSKTPSRSSRRRRAGARTRTTTTTSASSSSSRDTTKRRCGSSRKPSPATPTFADSRYYLGRPT